MKLIFLFGFIEFINLGVNLNLAPRFGQSHSPDDFNILLKLLEQIGYSDQNSNSKIKVYSKFGFINFDTPYDNLFDSLHILYIQVEVTLLKRKVDHLLKHLITKSKLKL